MALVNFKNSPSEETPLTGGASGTLNVMQENGTTHGSDTKLGYSQAFLNDHIVNISNEVDEDYRLNLLETKNLFDKNNYISNVNINSTTKIVQEASGNVSIIIPIKPNTTYTISKVSGDRFNVGSSPIYPTIGYTFTNLQVLYTATECTITTGANDKYLMAWVYTTADTHTQQETLDSIQVEEGNEATTYEAFVPNQILLDDEKYTDTLNVGSVVDSRSRVNVLYSHNLVNVSTNITGVMQSNGTIDTSSTYANYRTTDYIPVKPNTIYTLSRTHSGSDEDLVRIGTYQSNKTFIERTILSNNPGTITTASNCYYIRLSYGNTQNTNIQLVEGSSALPYEPYIVPSIYVDNEMLVSKNVYSTGEVVIGEWLGKPLYRKVVKLKPTSINTWEYLQLNNNLEEIINIYGYLHPSNYTQNRIPVLNSTNEFLCQTSNNGTLAIKTSNSNYLVDWTIAIEYTKTTD